MKSLLLTMTSVLLATLPLWAEKEATPNDPASREAGRGTEGFHRQGPPATEGEHIDKWLAMLKERNPEEFEKMQRMRQDNPEEFRRHLHQKLQEVRMRGGSMRERPQVMKVLRDLPAEDREWVMQRLQSGGTGMAVDGRRGFPDFRHVMSPEIEQGERRCRELARTVRDATTEGAKVAAKQELRGQIAIVFDLREKQRAEMVRTIDEKVAKLRQQLEERKNRREQLIDEEVQKSISGDRLLER